MSTEVQGTAEQGKIMPATLYSLLQICCLRDFKQQIFNAVRFPKILQIDLSLNLEASEFYNYEMNAK